MPAPEVFTQWSKRLPRQPLVDRDSFLIDCCRNRRVVHLGACDWPFTRDKAAQGVLLHQKLAKVCSQLIGYDQDQESIDLLKNEFGINDIVFRDLSRADADLKPAGETILCGDIIEHVNSVGDLLINCNRLLEPGGRLVVSTINALSIKQTLRSCFGREAVHPDHVAYYSYSTLGVALARWGFQVVDCRFFPYGESSTAARLLFGALLRAFPQSADGIVVVAEKVRAV